ncbi:FRG domain-containing protein, partial [Limosilactobacillus reuteri]
MNSNNKAITSVSEFITEIERHYSDGKEYFFRGESKDYVTIIPNLYREPTWLIKDSTDYYKRLSIELGLKNTDSISVIDQMATLQHYGAKSRLLDITSNALIALFFAVENTAEEKNGIVRVFNGKVFFDSGHTIAAKTAANFMDISLIKNFYKYCHDFLNSQEFLKNIREAIIQCSTYGNGLKWSNDLNNVEPYPINNSANVIAELRHMTTSEMMKKMPSFDLIDFMEKLNQITKTRERLNKPLAIFFDMHLPQIYLSTFSNDRIKRQQGAFITPPILGGGDRDNPEEVNTLYKAKV